MTGERKPTNQEHYEFFKSCIISNDEFDHVKWSILKKDLEKRKEEIDLSNADFQGLKITGLDLSKVYLIGVDFSNAELFNANFSQAKLVNVKLVNADLRNSDFTEADISDSYLSGADFSESNLFKANLSRNKLSNEENEIYFSRANLSCVNFTSSNYCDADFSDAFINGSNFSRGTFSRAKFIGANLSAVDFSFANLPEANFKGGNLSGTKFLAANLEGAKIIIGDLSGANFIRTNLKGTFLSSGRPKDHIVFDNCIINKMTDFRKVDLNKIDFSDGSRQTVEYINRRHNWFDWYEEHTFLKWIVKPFWWSSDYGRSIIRVGTIFIGFSIIFSLIYFIWPDLLQGLKPYNCICEELTLTSFQRLNRSLYFSVVTMTTLGFGDIHANPTSITGYWLLMFQVVLGYVLLGALITYLSIVFQSDGPAQSLEEEKNVWYKRLYRKVKKIV